MRPLRVRIDVTNGTATPAQPDPQTIHLNAAQQQKTAPPQNAAPQLQASHQPETATPHATPHAASRALLLQAADIPAETARLVRCHNPWPSEDVYFCPEDALPAFVTGVPALSSGSELWIAIHNHRPEPLRLHSGQNISILEVVTVADAPSSTPETWTYASTTCAGASLSVPAAAAERPLQGVQRCLQPRRGRPRLYSAAGAYD